MYLKEFANGEFDIVFSNSVIEHLGNYTKQLQMAREVQRVGKNYFLQTPNYYFPVEPHFMFPCFHWLPVSVRIFLVRHFNLGWIKRIKDYQRASEIVNEINLLKLKELKLLFPQAIFIKEKFFGITKSFILYQIKG